LEILRNIQVPTGNILVVQGEKGKLECLSLGDYGKSVNIKADFMGLDRELKEVTHTELLPLSKKWVITISPQYGCSIGCDFCDVPLVGPGLNATQNDMIDQVETAMGLHPEVITGERLNIHFARMGEPTYNDDVINAAYYIRDTYRNSFLVHAVVSTMLPKGNKNLKDFLYDWMTYKNYECKGEAGLQLSINSTDEQEREKMFNGKACSLKEIGELVPYAINIVRGRKVTLNFAIANYEISPHKLLNYFDPDKFLCKLTPMHKTVTAIKHGIKTSGDYTQYYPYQRYEEALKRVGYDVLVFIASKEEDLGRITCGNAILSGTMPEVEYKEL